MVGRALRAGPEPGLRLVTANHGPRADVLTPPQARGGARGAQKKEVLPGLEPGLQGSEPWVLTNYTIGPLTSGAGASSCF